MQTAMFFICITEVMMALTPIFLQQHFYFFVIKKARLPLFLGKIRTLPPFLLVLGILNSNAQFESGNSYTCAIVII